MIVRELHVYIYLENFKNLALHSISNPIKSNFDTFVQFKVLLSLKVIFHKNVFCPSNFKNKMKLKEMYSLMVLMHYFNRVFLILNINFI